MMMNKISNPNKIILILFASFLIALPELFAQQLELPKLRVQYIESANSEDKANSLWNSLNNLNNPSSIFLAYKGAVKAILAKYQWFVYKKYSFAKEGISILNKAIAKEPENIEIRYLRFTIEYHLPGFLGLSKDLQVDKNKFIENMEKRNRSIIDNNFFKDMVTFFIQSKVCTEKEIELLKTEAGIQ